MPAYAVLVGGLGRRHGSRTEIVVCPFGSREEGGVRWRVKGGEESYGFRIQHSLGASRWGGALRVKVGGGGEVLVPWSEAIQILLQIKSKRVCLSAGF